MLPRILMAGFHYLALGVGLGSVVTRGLRLRDLRRDPADARALAGLLAADSLWGVAAGLWLVTGLVRLLAGLDKATIFYMRNGFFHLKMTLFLLVFALEILPMVTFIKWRAAARRGAVPVAATPLGRLVRINDVEVALVLLLPFVAALMARGAWLF
jgi:putative membrane protein